VRFYPRVFEGGCPPDLFDLRHAALMVVQDVITLTGEFADIDFQPLAG
jgi:hypothetical protein